MTYLLEFGTAGGPRTLESFAFEFVGDDVEVRPKFVDLPQEGVSLFLALVKLVAERFVVL